MADEQNNNNELDQEQGFWDDYAEAKSATTLPPEGAYYLRFPDEMPDGNFEVKQDNAGKRYLRITLDPVTISQGDHKDFAARFFSVTTKPIQELVKKGDSWEPGKTLNASDAADVLKNFGTGDTPRTAEEWKSAFRRLAGQETPHPFYLVWSGYDKNAAGKAKYLRSKDFPKNADGSRPSYVERTNAATGETYRVFARLTLGRRGAAPKN